MKGDERERGGVETPSREGVSPGTDPPAYLTVPVYTEFQRWLGRGSQLEELLAAWNGGDRKRAVEVVPDALVSDLFVTGTPAECAAGVQRYLDAGVDIATLALLPPFGRELSA